MTRRLLILAQPVSLIVYSAVQWLLFIYFIHAGGLALGGDFALAQAIIAPVFALLSFSLRQVWVTRAKDGLDYGGLVMVRLATTGLALVAILGVVQAIGLSLHPAPFLLVLFLKSQEAVADILYARLDSEKRSVLAGLLMTLKGGLMGVAIVAAMAASLPLATACLIVAAAAAAVLLLEAAAVLSLGGRKRIDLRRSVAAIAPALKPIAWLSVANLLITIAGFLPRYALEVFAGREEVGLFTAVSMPAGVMLLICTGLAQASLHELAGTVDDRAFDRFTRLLRRLFALVLALVAAAAIFIHFGGTAVLGMFGKALDPSLAGTMIVVLFIFVPVFVSQILSYVFLALRTYRRHAIINGAGLATQLLLAWPLIRLDPIYGAAGLLAIVATVQSTAFATFLIRHFRTPRAPADPATTAGTAPVMLNDL